MRFLSRDHLAEFGLICGARHRELKLVLGLILYVSVDVTHVLDE
jgi:hypothetical protein